MLLSVDDLHWCDPASLRYLAYLVRRLDGLGVLAVATVRPQAGAEPSVIDEIADNPDATVLRLAPLSGDGVTTLLSAHFGADIDPEFVSSVTEWTGGEPAAAAGADRGGVRAPHRPHGRRRAADP